VQWLCVCFQILLALPPTLWCVAPPAVNDPCSQRVLEALRRVVKVLYQNVLS
jgi:hypothetical protein